MEEDGTPTVSLVSCMHFVRRGIAKSVPEKIELTEKELEKIIKQTAEELRLTEDGDDQSDEEGQATESVRAPPADPNDEFDFANYDQEESGNPVGIGTIATLPNLGDLSENIQIRTEGPDSDEEDDIIKPDDNLLLVGHVETDASVLEVYIFNKEEGSFYVHHDIILPWFPLCIEWLSHDPSDPQPGNLCALGGMDPVIQVWDLDIENCLEPAFKLGKKPNKKKKTKRIGHKDAVLDLSWNRNFSHVLASGSADNTVLLWDLDQGLPHTKLTYFEDKIQSLSFHPLEAQTLLSGCCDGAARVSDCRHSEARRTWKLPGEIERVLWDSSKPFCFAMSNNVGKVAYVDVRQEEPLWTIDAHQKEVTGLILSEQIPGLMITVGSDEKLKTWDISGPSPIQISERTNRVGQALCASQCPDAPYAVAVGGDNKECYIEMVDLTKSDEWCCDGAARVSDCRHSEARRTWKLPGEIERVLWDSSKPFCFAMSNNVGKVAYVDVRQEEPLWTIDAHQKEVTGLILSEQIPGLMITVGSDEKLKTWDISGPSPIQISERTNRVGQALCASQCPDAPYAVAVGGDNKECYIEMVDLTKSDEFMNKFGPRKEGLNNEAMDT